MQPGLRFNGLNINFGINQTEFLVSIPPWTWHCTEGEIRDTWWGRSIEVSFFRGTVGACMGKPSGFSRMNMWEGGVEELKVVSLHLHQVYVISLPRTWIGIYTLFFFF